VFRSSDLLVKRAPLLRTKPRKTILVIDDHEDILSFIQLLLDANGYVTLTAKDGKTGLALFRKHKPDLLITDIFMPEMSGIEVITQLLKINPDLKIIALSGAEDVSKRLEYLGVAMTAGATRFLQKPLEAAILLDTVRRSLRRTRKP
jgi:CheY-like chemotaxis protein